MLITRTSSRRNSKLSSRRNWTTDLQVQNEHLYTPQLPQSESPQDENVCLLYSTLLPSWNSTWQIADIQAWLKDKRKMMKKLNCDNYKLNWLCNTISFAIISLHPHRPVIIFP